MLENSLAVAQALGEAFVNPMLERMVELFLLPLFELIDDDRSLLPEADA